MDGRTLRNAEFLENQESFARPGAEAEEGQGLGAPGRAPEARDPGQKDAETRPRNFHVGLSCFFVVRIIITIVIIIMIITIVLIIIVIIIITV